MATIMIVGFCCRVCEVWIPYCHSHNDAGLGHAGVPQGVSVTSVALGFAVHLAAASYLLFVRDVEYTLGSSLCTRACLPCLFA